MLWKCLLQHWRVWISDLGVTSTWSQCLCLLSQTAALLKCFSCSHSSLDSSSPPGQSHRSEVLRHRIKDFQRHVQQTAWVAATEGMGRWQIQSEFLVFHRRQNQTGSFQTSEQFYWLCRMCSTPRAQYIYSNCFSLWCVEYCLSVCPPSVATRADLWKGHSHLQPTNGSRWGPASRHGVHRLRDSAARSGTVCC